MIENLAGDFLIQVAVRQLDHLDDGGPLAFFFAVNVLRGRLQLLYNLADATLLNAVTEMFGDGVDELGFLL